MRDFLALAIFWIGALCALVAFSVWLADYMGGIRRPKL